MNNLVVFQNIRTVYLIYFDYASWESQQQFDIKRFYLNDNMLWLYLVGFQLIVHNNKLN